MSNGVRTPSLAVKKVNIAAGVTETFDSIGVQRAVYLPAGIMAQNPILKFGPNGVSWAPNTTVGLFIQFDEDFDEFTISVPAAATANATGDVLMSGCSNFLMMGV